MFEQLECKMCSRASPAGRTDGTGSVKFAGECSLISTPRSRSDDEEGDAGDARQREERESENLNNYRFETRRARAEAASVSDY